MEKKIILGTVDMDWHFTIGKYNCNCANLEDTNAFDRVICGILSKDGGFLERKKLASIIGFNVVDDHHDNQYCDHSEKAIFDAAVTSLVEYGLVEAGDDFVTLTEKGREALKTRKKQHKETKEVQLCVDEFLGASFSDDIVKGVPRNPIDNEAAQSLSYWNLLRDTPMEVLKKQKNELFDAAAGKDVKTMDCLDIKHFAANLKCYVCYDVGEQKLSVSSMSVNPRVNELLSNDNSMQSKLLDKFFSDKKASVLYKQAYQDAIEKTIINSDSETNECDNVITCKDSFKQLKDIGNATILYFSIRKITDRVKDYLHDLCCDIVCVDYVEGDFDKIDLDSRLVIEDNVRFFKVDELRTSDLCVCGKSFYSALPYIVDYEGIQYSIPMVYGFSENKYNLAVLFEPYIDFILLKAVNFTQSVVDERIESLIPPVVNRTFKLCDAIERINFVFEESKQNAKFLFKKLNKLKQKVFDTWKNSIHERLYKLEAEIVEGQERVILQDMLKQIQSDIKDTETICDEDVFKHFSEVEQRLSPAISGPRIKSQTNYILDTNIFMDNPEVLNKFDLANDKVIVPRSMEQELDRLAHDPDKADAANKALKLLRKKQRDYPQFLSIKDDVKREHLPNGFDHNKHDNDIIATAIELDKSDSVDKIVVVTNDKELYANIKDISDKKIISERVDVINLDELLIKLDE